MNIPGFMIKQFNNCTWVVNYPTIFHDFQLIISGVKYDAAFLYQFPTLGND